MALLNEIPLQLLLLCFFGAHVAGGIGVIIGGTMFTEMGRCEWRNLVPTSVDQFDRHVMQEIAEGMKVCSSSA